MKRSKRRYLIATGVVIALALAACRVTEHKSPKPGTPGEPDLITIDYPAEGSVFPPEFPAPRGYGGIRMTRPLPGKSTLAFSDGASPIHVESIRRADAHRRKRSPLRFSQQCAPGADPGAGSGAHLDAG